jgi:hypothetical protein
MENMEGMATSGMADMAMGPNMPISSLTEMNADAEIDAAVAMHDSTTMDATSAGMMSMMASGATDPISNIEMAIISVIGVVPDGFWWAAFIFFVLAFALLLYLFRKAGAPAAMRRGRAMKWSTAAALFLAVICGASLAILHAGSFASECAADGNSWGQMQPSVAGEPFSQTPSLGCMWGMGSYVYMFSDKRQYDYYEDLPPATATFAMVPQQAIAGTPATLTVSLKNADGTPATLFVDMDKVLHVIIISKDEAVFAHIHPDDAHPLTPQEIKSSTFSVSYTFPKSGDYLVAFDYAHGLTLESKQFQVHVAGSPAQSAKVAEYPIMNTFDGYKVSLKYPLPIAGQVETIVYTITKDGKPVTFVPWLDAAMHVSVVKNDFSWYLHVHGEVHPPGSPLPPIIVKNGQVLHSMAMMVTPAEFSLPIEAHLIFPTPGIYTVWGQFKTLSGDLVATAFTVQVEQ